MFININKKLKRRNMRFIQCSAKFGPDNGYDAFHVLVTIPEKGKKPQLVGWEFEDTTTPVVVVTEAKGTESTDPNYRPPLRNGVTVGVPHPLKQMSFAWIRYDAWKLLQSLESQTAPAPTCLPVNDGTRDCSDPECELFTKGVLKEIVEDDDALHNVFRLATLFKTDNSSFTVWPLFSTLKERARGLKFLDRLASLK